MPEQLHSARLASTLRPLGTGMNWESGGVINIRVWDFSSDIYLIQSGKKKTALLLVNKREVFFFFFFLLKAQA